MDVCQYVLGNHSFAMEASSRCASKQRLSDIRELLDEFDGIIKSNINDSEKIKQIATIIDRKREYIH